MGWVEMESRKKAGGSWWVRQARADPGERAEPGGEDAGAVAYVMLVTYAAGQTGAERSHQECGNVVAASCPVSVLSCPRPGSVVSGPGCHRVQCQDAARMRTRRDLR